MDIKSSGLPNVLILSDSHGKCINRQCSARFNTIIKAVSGLKWVDYRDEKLCLQSMLSLSEIRSLLSQATAVLFIVGTNSIRIMSASRVIEQVREIIQSIQRNYYHLNNTKKINVAYTFPCLKPTGRFPNRDSLLSNINQYNQKLFRLSVELNFTIVDFDINEYHLANDKMHVYWKYHDRIVNSISNHFNDLISSLSRSTTISDISITSQAATSNEIEIQTQSSQRSRQANDQRNEKRHEKLTAKLDKHMIKRQIDSQWTQVDIKKYLRSIPVKFGRILPIHKQIVRIQFYNENDKDYAENALDIDVFSKDHYQEVIKKQKN